MSTDSDASRGGLSLSEVGAQLGMTVEGVRKVELKALRKVAAALEQRGYKEADFFEVAEHPTAKNAKSK